MYCTIQSIYLAFSFYTSLILQGRVSDGSALNDINRNIPLERKIVVHQIFWTRLNSLLLFRVISIHHLISRYNAIEKFSGNRYHNSWKFNNVKIYRLFIREGNVKNNIGKITVLRFIIT